MPPEDEKNAPEGQDAGQNQGMLKKVIIVAVGTLLLIVLGLVALFVLSGESDDGDKARDEQYDVTKKIEFLVLVNKAQGTIIKDFICEMEIIIAKTDDQEMERKEVDNITEDELDKYVTLLNDRKAIIMNEVIRLLGNYEFNTLAQSNTNTIQEEVRDRLYKFIIDRFSKHKSAAKAKGMIESINFKMFKFQPN